MNKKGESLAEFMRRKPEIEYALKEYYVIKFAYNVLKESGAISCTYDNFRKLCNRYILNKERETNSPPVKKTPSSPTNGKPHSRPEASGDIFRSKPKVIHNPSMTEERKKELF